VELPRFEFGPAFLLRDTLETCDSYDAAVRTLSESALSTSVFFTVCGTARGQACVIERTQREAVVRPLTGTVLVQANHHVAGQFAENNEDIRDGAAEDVFSLAGSDTRAATLSRALTELPAACPLNAAALTLNTGTVLNPDTCQQMVFCPGSGEVCVWRKTVD
jgi:hypothetical protein